MQTVRRSTRAGRLSLIVLVLCAVGAMTLLMPGLATSARAAMLPLRSIRGSTPRIVDSAGRQVLLRGVDVDALGQYYQQYAAYPAVLPLTDNDFREMAGLGFNVVRLVLSWSALEPRPGSFNLAYVRRIRRAVRWATANGIYVVLDMHQDAWGISVRGSADTTCPPGSSPPVGYDGAPAWATFTDDQPRCAVDGVREISPADEAAWQNFYDNADGIQTQLVDTWARLASAFAADPDIAGYDLLNEPNPGLTFGEATGELGDYYTRVLSAIRAAEDRVRGGFHHIAFFEPGVEWSAAGTTAVPEGSFTRDSDIVFAPHLYGGSLAVASVDQGYEYAAKAAAGYHTTVWAGEYGWYGSPAANEADIANFARDQDEYLWGGAWWQWKQACGSPSTIGSFGQAVPAETNSLVRITCHPGAIHPGPLPSTGSLAIPTSTERIIARATVHAAPGRILSLVSDPSTGGFSMRGSVSGPARRRGPSCTLQVWIPNSGRPRFSETGLTSLTMRRVRGGYDVDACVHGSYSLRLVSRARPGLGCRRAVSARLVSLAGRRLTIGLHESRKAESACTGTATLRVGRAARADRAEPAGRARDPRSRFRVRPGRSVLLSFRLSPVQRDAIGAHHPLVARLVGEDVDANRFHRSISILASPAR